MGQNSRYRGNAEEYDSDDSGDGTGDLKRSSFYKQEENSISRVQLVIKKCLFNANYQMIHSFKLPYLILYGILAIEFLQINYFSFYHLQLHNDTFTQNDDALLTQSTHNAQGHITSVNFESQYNIMKLLNYQILIKEMQQPNSLVIFEVTLYIHLLFYLILIFLVLILGRRTVMRQEKFLKGAHQSRGRSRQSVEEKSKKSSEHSKSSAQSTEALVISILVFIGQKILLIPTFYMISSTLDCSKIVKLSASSETSHMQCFDLHHLIMLSVSMIIGVIIAIFLLFESILFQDLNMKQGLPWRQTTSRLPAIHVLQKLICVMFNFELLSDKPVAIGIFSLISFVVVVKRYQYPRIYDPIYRRITYFVECGTLWFALWNFLSRADFDVSYYSLTILTILGLIPFYIVTEIGSDIKAEAYFGYLIELIKDADESQAARLQLYGIMRTHSYSCHNGKIGDCLCKTLISRVDILCSIIEEQDSQRSEQMNIQQLQKQIEKITEQVKEQEDQEQRKNSGFTNDQRKFTSFITEIQSMEIDPSDSIMDRQGSNEDIEGSIYMHSQIEQASSLEKKFKAQLQKKVLIAKINEIQNSLMQKKKMKKQIKTLFYKFVYQQLEQANQEFSFSFRLKYLQAFIQFHLLKNEIKGLFEILILEKRNKIPLEWQFFLYKVKAEIEDQMNYQHRERSKSSGKIDVKKVYFFSRNLQQFEHKIENMSNKCVDFWKELLKENDFDANVLHKIGTYLTQKNHDIVELVNKMFEINPHHGYLLRIYALFLQQVMNNDEESEKYFTKFLNAQKTFQHYECASLQEELLKNFSSNIKYVIIVMRVTTTEIGTIEDANHEVKTLLGYKRQEVIGQNLQMLMPPSVAKLHNQFVQNYLDTAKPKILNKQREVFALKKNGYIQQVFIYVTSVPMIERQGIKFVGFLKKVDEKKYTELLQQPNECHFQKSLSIIAAPNGNIYGMNDQCFKVLGLPKYFVDESDDKLSDFNMNFLIKDFKQVLFNSLRNSPGITNAILSTEGFHSYIVPEMHSRIDLNHIRGCLGTFNVAIQALPIDFGYQGGAYLPTIFFRIYILDQMSKQQPKHKLIHEKLKSFKSFRSNLVLNKLKMFTSKNSVREENKEEVKQQELESEYFKMVDNNLNQPNQNQLTSERRHSISVYDSESQIHSQMSNLNIAKTFSQRNMLEEVDMNESDIREEEFKKIMDKINKKNEEHQVMNDFLNLQSCSLSTGSASREVKSQDENRLRQFRKMVNSRKEPYIIVQLRRLVIFIKLLTKSILLLNIGFKIKFYLEFLDQNDQINSLNDITMNLFHISSDFRTLMNIQNNVQENFIDGDLSQGQFSTIITQNLNKTITQLNDNRNYFFKNSHLESITEQSVDAITTKSIDSFGNVTSDQKSSLNLELSQIISNSLALLDFQTHSTFLNKTFIDYISHLNVTQSKCKYGKFGEQIDDAVKSLYFLEENIYPSLIDFTEELRKDLNQYTHEYIRRARSIFIGFLLSVFFIIFFSICGILKLITEIKKTRIQSLSLYSQLNTIDVKQIVQKITQFLTLIQEKSETLSYIFQQEGNQLTHKEADEEDDDELFDELNNDEQERMKMVNIASAALTQSLTKDLTVPNDIVIKIQLKQEVEMNGEIDMSYRENELSMRQLNPDQEEQMPRRSMIQNKRKKSSKEGPQIVPDKIGHEENFKQVKSNSGFSVFAIVLILYAFIVFYVTINFILYIPMFGVLLHGQNQKDLILTFQNENNKLYVQMMKDLVTGTIELEEGRSGQSKYSIIQDEQFKKNSLIEQILVKDHVSFLSNAAQLYLQFNSQQFCDTLKQRLNDGEWDYEYCLNTDHSIAGSQGLFVTLKRVLGEIDQLGLGIKTPTNYTATFNLIKKGQWMAKYQLMMIRLFTPASIINRDTISQSLKHYVEVYQKIDISMLAVFICIQFLILIIAWPRFIRKMNEQITKSRGILTLIPSKLIVSNDNIKQIIKENKILTM